VLCWIRWLQESVRLTALEQGLSLDEYQLFSAAQTGVAGAADAAGSAGAAAGKI
jgi:hypothetical protein